MKRIAVVSGVTLVLLVGWCLHWASEVSVPEVSLPSSPAPVREFVADQPMRGALVVISPPLADPTPMNRATPIATAAPVDLSSQQAAEWLPPARTDKVFDLNGNGRVEADEQERGDELLERAHHFATQRSKDGSYPILKASFQGEGRFFRAMDSNADGALSEREFLAYETESIRELRRYDQNADGALTLTEYGHLQSRFDYLDDDHDGQLYAWEISLVRGRGKW